MADLDAQAEAQAEIAERAAAEAAKAAETATAPSVDAKVAEAPTGEDAPATASPVATSASVAPAGAAPPVLDEATLAILKEVEALSTGSVAEKENAARNLAGMGMSREEVRELLAEDRANAARAAASPATPTEESILAGLPEDVRPVVMALNELAAIRGRGVDAKLAELTERQRMTDAKQAEAAIEREFDSTVAASPVARLFASTKDDQRAADFKEYALFQAQKLHNQRVMETQRQYGIRGRAISFEQAERLTPPPTKADFAAGVRAAEPAFAAAIEVGKRVGRATPPASGAPPPLSRHGGGATAGVDGGSAADAAAALKGGDDYTTQAGREAALARAIRREFPSGITEA